MKKTNWTKRGLAALVALGMCLGMTNLSAFAAETNCPKNPDYPCEYTTKETKPATCGEDGEVYSICKYCGDTITLETLPATGEHTYTCSEEATKIVYTCNDCGYQYSEDKVCQHEYRKEVIVEATCDKDGLKQIVCADCNEVISESTCPKLEHVFIDGECKYCHKCENIDATGCHKVDKTEHAATCTEPGYVEYKCPVCGYTLPEENISEPLDPVFSDWTDDGNGLTQTRVCVYCNGEAKGHSETQPIPESEHKHNLKFHEGYGATCTEDGCKDYYCCTDPDCGKTFLDPEGTIEATKDNKTIPALGHVCGELKWDGEQHWTECDRCGVVIGEKKAHEWTEVSRKDATCTEPGEIKYDCSLLGCNASKDVEIPALGHVCGELKWDGEQHWTECDRCGVVIGEKKAHEWTEVSRKDATCTEPGEIKYDCSLLGCNASKDVEIPALGHELEAILQGATCTDSGLTGVKCTRPGCDYRDAISADAIGHDYKIIEQIEGDSENHRLICGNDESHTAVAPHNFGAWETVREATETVAGEERHVCGDCGYVETRLIPATGTGDDNTPTTPVTPVIPGDDGNEPTPPSPSTPVIPGGDEPTPPSPSTPVTPGGDDNTPTTPVTPVVPDDDDDDDDTTTTPVTPATPDADDDNDTPVVTIPDADVPMAGTPAVDDDVRMPDAPEVSIPDADVPLADVPEVTILDVDVPLAGAPEVTVPDEDVPLADAPEAEIPDADVPLADIPEMNVPLADMPMEIAIPDEEVPLADVPKTGDNSQVWAIFALASGAGLAWLALSESKRKADAE